MPTRTREAMLHGIDSNKIIVGAYVDNRNGGVCPMLAAHRNGGRTNFGTFARAWDQFTGVGRKPRRASRREIRALRGYLEMSLANDGIHIDENTSLAAEIRDVKATRRRLAETDARESDGVTIEQLLEQVAADVEEPIPAELGEPEPTDPRSPPLPVE
jgi:hypothetical protein